MWGSEGQKWEVNSPAVWPLRAQILGPTRSERGAPLAAPISAHGCEILQLAYAGVVLAMVLSILGKKRMILLMLPHPPSSL